MFATHNPRLIRAKTHNKAVNAEIIGDIDPRLICSKTTAMRKPYWYCPASSNEPQIPTEALKGKPERFLPDIDDDRYIKQVLFPTVNWNGEVIPHGKDNPYYVSVSPLESMGLLNELNERIKTQALPARALTIEFDRKSYANHGELLVKYKGKLSLITRSMTVTILKQEDETPLELGIPPLPVFDEKDKLVTGFALKFTVEDCNIAAGFMSMGHPAITSVGSLVQHMEFELGFKINFAVGLNSIEFRGVRPRYHPVKLKKQSLWGEEGEMTGAFDIVLVLKCDPENMNALDAYVNRKDKPPFNRFASGEITNYSVIKLVNQEPPNANYLMDCTEQNVGGVDSLQSALKWYSRSRQYAINQSGVAYLEQPTHRSHTRHGYKHAWAEPIYVLIRQSVFSPACFWEQRISENWVRWAGVLQSDIK